ncbi:MAG: hypothetical protein GC187_03315 [Alphaproteobacteria bacterium]|nr:hypothetical protein [Alphaproteobacteria bacterium]
MVSVVSLGSGTTLAKLQAGQFGLMQHEMFDGPSLILRLDDNSSAALFARHREREGALGAFAISADQQAWGRQEIIALNNVKIICDHRSATVESDGISYEKNSTRGSVYEFEGGSGFMLYSFRTGASVSFWSFDGKEIKTRPEVAARYSRWTLDWYREPSDPQTIFSWPPQST